MTRVLDCTLRDGGYYVNWDFEPDTVRKYLSALSTAKLDIIEIGFRFLPRNKFHGAFAYSTDGYLSKLNLPAELPIAVMINAAEVIKYNEGEVAAIDFLFNKKDESSVDIVRIAVKACDVALCKGISERLKAMGYRVFLNLMHIDSVPLNEVEQLAELVERWGDVETLYFADSFGNLEPESVKSIVKSIQKTWSGSIGIHAHDNKGLSLSNSLAAIDCGVAYIDSTLSGMGRGAGNTKTEFLLIELLKHGQDGYFPDAIFPLVLQEFSKLQKEHQWGPSIYYYLSALHGIHPTYIQEMLVDERYDTDQILSAINFLKHSNSSFYSFDNMIRSSAGVEGSEFGKWSAKAWAKGREVLIIGSGESTERYIDEIQRFVNRYNLFVLCLNINEAVPREMVDAYVACHDMRILIESSSYIALETPLVLPLSRVPESIRHTIEDAHVYDYGLRIEEDQFSIMDNGCVLGSQLALAYAISIATASGAKQILLAGVDGYTAFDPRQQEMNGILESYGKCPGALPLKAITPTSYLIDQKSIYELRLLG